MDTDSLGIWEYGERDQKLWLSLGLILRLIILLNYQFYADIISGTRQLIGGIGDWQFRRTITLKTRTWIRIPTISFIIIQLTTAWPSKAMTEVVCHVLRVLVLLNCQFFLAIISGMLQLSSSNGHWQFRMTRNEEQYQQLQTSFSNLPTYCLANQQLKLFVLFYGSRPLKP